MIFDNFCIKLLVAFIYVNAVSCEEVYSICKTNACKKIAKTLHKSIDHSVKPCEDIYRHVCGKWIQSHPIDNGEGYSTKPDLQKVFRTRYQNILNEPPKSQESNLLSFAKRIYKKCMKPNKNKTAALTTLIKIINSIGVWPLITRDENALGSTTWQEISKKVDSTFVSNALYTVAIELSGDNPERYIVALAQPTTFFPRKFPLHETTPDLEKVNAYRQYIKSVVAEITANTGTQLFTKRKTKDIDDLLKFEIAVLQILSTSEENISNYYRMMSFIEFQSLYNKEEHPTKNGKINWADIVRNRLTASKVSFNPTITVRVYSLNYFEKLAHLLEKTSTRVIVNYLIWHFVRILLPFTTPKMLQYATNANRVVKNKREKSDADRCLETPNLFPVVTNEYLKRYFPASDRSKVVEILKALKTEVVFAAAGSSWIDPVDRNQFMKMISSNSMLVGHPDWYYGTRVQDHYATLNLSDRLLVEDVLSIIKFSANDAAKKVGTIVKVMESVDDYYLYSRWIDQTRKTRYGKELILLPIGMFYHALIDSQRPEAMNYGTVGFDVGYDISNGFGTLYNSILRDTTKPDITPLEIRKCIEDFHRASVTDTAVGPPNRNDSYVGILTFIGDLSATSAAWNTWENRKSNITNKDVRLPGLLQYSSDQLFFIAITYNYCEHKKISNNHVRLWNAFAHSEGFSKAFKCPKSSPMNLPRKCEIWT